MLTAATIAPRSSMPIMPIYNAYPNRRSEGAKSRNYSNCDQCKKAHQKCSPTSNGGPCGRCKTHKYICSRATMSTTQTSQPSSPSTTTEGTLPSSSPSTLSSPSASSSTSIPSPNANTSTRNMMQVKVEDNSSENENISNNGSEMLEVKKEEPVEDVSLHDDDFGRIIYVLPHNKGQNVYILHARKGRDNQEQVFWTNCDKDYKPIEQGAYLGPIDVFLPKFRENIISVSYEDRVNAKKEFNL